MSTQYLLNHMAIPALSATELLQSSHSLHFSGIELRNDIGNGDPLRGEPIEQIRDLAAELGQNIFSINALQRCNDASIQEKLIDTLQSLAKIGRDLHVSAIVMCPVNDQGDPRSGEQQYRELVSNLITLAPVFEDSGLVGLVEPLGFPQSSLRSLSTALRAIAESGKTCYRGLLDTFHFALGTDGFEELNSYALDAVGLVHVSGVESDTPYGRLTDDDRVLVGAGDRLETRRQVSLLRQRGYAGFVSFEPFSPVLHRMPVEEVVGALRESASYLD